MNTAEQTIAAFAASLAEKSPAPGGGAAVGVVGAIGASLAHMVVAYSLGRKSLAEHQPLLEDASKSLRAASDEFLLLADRDAQAYGAVNELMRLDERDPRRVGEMPAAVRTAIEVPVRVMALGVEALQLCERLADKTNPHLASDLVIAAQTLEQAVRSSRSNIAVNMPLLEECGESLPGFMPQQDAERLIGESKRHLAAVVRACTAT